MEPLDSEELVGEARRNARRNAEAIRENILKLTRLCGEKAIQDKLSKETNPRNNEINQFLETFNQMQELWQIKLTTPLEEVESVKQQLKTLRARQLTLEEKLKNEQEKLHSYKESSRELKAQKQKEKDMLTDAIRQKTNDKKNKDLKLRSEGKEMED